jgi:MFS family permease
VRSRLRNVLRLPAVRRFFAGGLLSVAGDWMLLTALPFHVLVLTGSTAATGAMFVAFALPRVLFSLLGGWLTDRFDRRLLMIGCDLARAALLLPLLAVTSKDQLWLVLAVTVAQSTVGQVFMPARNAALPALVPTDLRVTANSVDALMMGLTRLVGPVAGGALLAGLGFRAVVLIDAATFVLSAVLIAGIRIPRPAPLGRVPAGRLMSDLAAGLRLCWRRPGPRAVLATSAVVMLGYGLTTALGVVFIRVVLGGTAADFGWMMAAQGIGLTAGGLVVSRAGRRVSHRWLFVCGLLFAGASFLAMFESSSLALVFPFAVASGVGLASWMVGERTLLQRGIPAQALGVAFGAYNTLNSVLALCGTALAGVLAPALGIRYALITAATAYLLPGLLVAGHLLAPARPDRRRQQAVRPAPALPRKAA